VSAPVRSPFGWHIIQVLERRNQDMSQQQHRMRTRLALRARSRKRAAPFAVQPFQGDGLTPEFTAAGWDRIRDEIYRDRP